MIDPFTAYAAVTATRKWVPYAIGGGLGLTLGLIIAAGAWAWQGKEIASLEGQLKAMTDSRDIYQASAETQAQAVRDRGRSIDNLNLRIKGLVSLWRSTRAEAEQIATETKARAAVYAEAERKLKELSADEKADPADIAIGNFECLRKLREAGVAASPGAC